MEDLLLRILENIRHSFMIVLVFEIFHKIESHYFIPLLFVVGLLLIFQRKKPYSQVYKDFYHPKSHVA